MMDLYGFRRAARLRTYNANANMLFKQLNCRFQHEVLRLNDIFLKTPLGRLTERFATP